MAFKLRTVKTSFDSVENLFQTATTEWPIMHQSKIHIILLTLVAILAFLVTDARAANRYVDSAVASSGNGQSWATAWKTIGDITGVSAGDTVYFSGGSSGKSYSVSNWTPRAGTKANPITYAVGQDAGHTGMVTFTGSGNFLQNNLTGITINGEVNGNRRMTVSSNYNWTIYSDGNNTNGFKLLWVEFTSPIWGRGTGYEIAYCRGIAPLSMLDDSYIAHIGESGGGDHTANSIHHNYFQVNRIRSSGWGQDCFKWFANISIYNNVLISAYNASYPGQQHNDGYQGTGNNIWMYNNWIEGFISYPIFNQMWSNTSGWRIFNNVINSQVADQGSIDWGAYQCMALGFPSGGGSNVSDYIVANNICIGGSNRRGIHFNTGVVGTVGPGVYLVNNLFYDSDTSVYYNGAATVSNNLNTNSSSYFETIAAYPTGDFHLTSSATSAIDQGISPSYLTSVYTADADGVTRSGTWDIGAYEYYGGLPPPGNLTIISHTP